MKKLSIQIFAAMLVVAVLISGCGLKKMVKKYPTVTYEATPNPLEAHADSIVVTVKGNFPPKYFDKRAIVEFQPVLKYDGGEVPLKKVSVVGEKVTGVEGSIIYKAAGGSFTYNSSVGYDPKLNKSDLMVTVKASRKKKKVEMTERKLADGVIYTSTRIKQDGVIAIADHGYEKETFVTKSANIYFDYNKADLNLKTQVLNKLPENAAKLAELATYYQREWKIKSLNVDAWASPEGEENLNKELSDKRSKTADKYLKDLFTQQAKDKAKAANIKEKDMPPVQFPTITLAAKGEDWAGFQKALDASNIKDKNAISNVIKSQPTKAKREQEIRNMTVIYKEIEDNILSQLRRAEIVTTFYEPKKTDEQIAMFSTTSPDSLDVKEILYAGTLTQDMNTKYKVYKNATVRFPQEWKAYHNAGYAALNLNKVDEAATLFEKADALSPNNAMVLNALGVVALYKKDYATAQKHFDAAIAKGSKEAGSNLGVVMIKKGQYSAAISAFSGKTCFYNLGLAQLLNTNYSDASSTLECISNKTPDVYYLLAIIGARTNNTTMLYDNLKKACQDATLKSQAKDDREFIKYFSSGDFQNAIK